MTDVKEEIDPKVKPREIKNVTRTSSTIKILNDEKMSAEPIKLPVMTSVPLSPNKPITLCLAKPKANANKKDKKMDHYLMQTIKGERNAEGIEEGETIDFILTDTNEHEHEHEHEHENENGSEIAQPNVEICEEVHISDENDDHDDTYADNEKTQEIVEHVCGKCYKTFRRLKSLKKHLDYCRFDSGYHLRKAEMLKNLDKIEKDAVIMENKDVCFCCGESYDTYHLGHISCPDCPKSFKTQMSYERHIFITHSELNNHPCSICNAKLRSANLLKLHEEQHKSRGKPYACKICGKDFTRSYHLHRHQKFSSCMANENDSMKCKVCDKAFYRLDNLRQHLKQHLGTHTTKKPEYMCPMCKNCFYSLSTLNIHTRTHTGERPFDCDLCEKKFPSLVALKKHRRYHTGEKPYTCSVCKQSFAVKEVLNRHMKRHTGERPYVCSECGKSFIQGVQLRNHIKTHVRPYECDACPGKFKTEKQLQRHQKEHVISKRRGRCKYANKCEICKQGFRTQNEYAEHMGKGVHLTPAQKRKIKNRTDCAVCREDFQTVKNLQFHILKVHQEDPENFVNENPFDDDNSDKCIKKSIKENEDSIAMPPPKFIKIEDSKGQHRIEFITTNSKGEIIDTNLDGFEKKKNRKESQNNNNPLSPTSLTSVENAEQEFILNEPNATTSILAAGGVNPSNQTVILSNETFTIIPLESDGGRIETITTHKLPAVATKISITKSNETKIKQRKSLAESLAAAIADNSEDAISLPSDEEYELDEDDIKLKENVNKLLDMLVDTDTLKKFGWPQASEEKVLCRVIENCGYNLSKDTSMYNEWDYGTRMREYVKLLFTVVIHNEPIKELLNNYPIDEVIEYVLGNDDDDDDDDNDNEKGDDDDNDKDAGADAVNDEDKEDKNNIKIVEDSKKAIVREKNKNEIKQPKTS